MATKYLALLTNIGAAKLAKATALGTKVEITQLAVGDGNGVLPTPNPAQTALVHELRRAPLNMLTVDPANASQIIAEQVIPEDVGGWWIREIGLFDKDGDMVAIANCAETYKPQLQEGSGRVQVIRVILIVSSTEAVTLKIDPAVVLATRQYVDNKIIEVKSYADELMRTHEQSRNHPDATTSAKGFTQLNSSVTDDRETQSATPKAVKIAMDNANARLAKDRNLADLPNPALARQNLQLGDSSTKNTGTTANTVAAGDDARITGAMQKSQNGADIPDVAKFLQNLHLEELPNFAKYGAPMIGELIEWPSDKMPNEIYPDMKMEFIPYIGQSFDPVKYPLLATLHPNLRLPADMRANVARGWDWGRGIDAGRALMSAQDDAMQRITGELTDMCSGDSLQATGALTITAKPAQHWYAAATVSSAYLYYRAIGFDNASVARTANENRMKNVAWNMIVRAK
ncbi:TPA: phage tail protein [Citrobacter freundii]|uniref:Phage tail protein n=2 Tax=Citrobacter freundii TaxID=546 RepID=A0AA40TKV1_CITFR|nr:phage tail protein [Citrobacter freundii]EKX9621556.1 phage tail protein [Citrobacter freundii]KPR55865.1 phage tail protein [Citrobacter freundii]MBJ9115195.1 phage tail protein [Citrobacter freundii]MBJ9626199.1 phage tail protein [Citrobacter freundii]HBZ8827695.1 phage tail protein [Citrobacter freundii]